VAALGALALAAAAAAGPGGAAARRAAVGVVTVAGPPGTDTVRDLAPTFAIRTAGFTDPERPLRLRLEVSTSSTFGGPSIVDTTVIGDNADVALTRLLPERTPIYWRARAITAQGAEVVSPVTGPRPTAAYITLVFPNAPSGNVLSEHRPTFVWRGAGTGALGPWRYEFQLFVAGVAQPVLDVPNLTDTTFRPVAPLETNTSYRWAVRGTLASGDSARAQSRSSFVIVGASAPRVTLLYQNFPNPFPSPSSATTCIWFDLAETGTVRLDVYDVRGHLVRRLIPGATLGDFFTLGRYGRAASGGETGCDPRFTWDGRAEDGRVVQPGVYLLRLRASGADIIRKIVFRGT
jgi:hypothetical protein